MSYRLDYYKKDVDLIIINVFEISDIECFNLDITFVFNDYEEININKEYFLKECFNNYVETLKKKYENSEIRIIEK